jgi:hypothetical protein
MMAVTTSLAADGTLTVTGDADPNNLADELAIVGTGTAGELTLTGRNGTLIDGMASKTIAGVAKDLLINLGDGDNVINLDNIYLAGKLDLRSGNGKDLIVLGATGVVSTTGACTVQSGFGDDVVRAQDYHVFIVGQLLTRVGGGARSRIELTGASALGTIDVFGGDIGVNDIVLRGVTGANWLHVTAGAPINNVAVFTSAANENLYINCEDAQNSVYVDTCYSGRFIHVDTWSGPTGYFPDPPAQPPYNIDDTVTVARCQTPQIVVQTGRTDVLRYFGGNDTIYIYGNNIVGPPTQVTVPSNSPAHVLYVETGEGNDVLNTAYNVVRGPTLFSLFKGDDQLFLVGNLMTAFASADGGEGTNRLSLVGNQFNGFASTRFQ